VIDGKLVPTTSLKELPVEYQKSVTELANSYIQSEKFNKTIEESDQFTINQEFEDTLVGIQDSIYSHKNISKFDLEILKSLSHHIRTGELINELRMLDHFRKLSDSSKNTLLEVIKGLESMDEIKSQQDKL
jgi:dimeric dUTPase (all-alpha-NTP-PPase superfamily)